MAPSPLLSVLSFFFFSYSLGIQLFTPLIRVEAIGSGFIRLLAMNSFVSLILGVALQIAMGGWIYLPLGFGFLLALNNLWAYVYSPEKTDFGFWIRFAVNTFFIWLISYFLFPLEQVKFFLMTGLLGVSVFLMLLGHYYLVVPKLSEKPLLHGSYLLWGMLILNIIFSISQYSQDFFQEGSLQGFGYSFNWLMLLMRFGWGYLALGTLSLFAFRLSKIRSTQSATGIFYVMVFFVLIGELISLFALFSYRMVL